ncbi:MAG: S-layer homology domain-containing protein [Anaerotignum sp.]|nr:S-layer homology domain-containing protein [Anaerotignum sp.]MDY3926769.1 S-layer homology domain-containing protein [Anaerotignum sp.]
MKQHQTLRRGLGILISLIMCLGLLPVTALAEETSTDVEISEANFPDATFRQYVSDEFDTNNDDYLDNDEIQAVTEIDVYDEFVIESLTGIEYFTELKELDCAGNQLTTLDISNNTKVEMLDCDNNSLTKLKIGKNESLTDLYCSYNQLTTLDVSQNTGLINLQCEDNNLTSLDLSKNKKLEYLSCNNNSLTKLDVSDLTALTELTCSGNQLTTLDVSKNTSLTKLDCSENKLTFLDLSNTQVSDLSASDNVYEITLNEGRTFDLSTLPGEKFNVANVSSYDDSIGTIDNNTAVLTLASGADEFTYSYNCGKNKYIDFTLKVSGGGDTDDTTKYTVTASGFYEGVFGNETGAPFTLSYAAGEKVNMLIAAREGYTLKDLTLVGISEKDITWNTKEETTQRMIWFTMPANPVTVTVNWTANGSGGDVAIDTTNFPDKTFRDYVSDEFDDNSDGVLSDDEIAEAKRITCNYREISNLKGIEHFTALTALNCSNNKLTNLDVSSNTALEYLNCSGNQLTELEVGSNTALMSLYCGGNPLTSLNVSQNTALTTLSCTNNSLTKLDVSDLTKLTELTCSGNPLTSLDVSQNHKLETLYCSSCALTSLDLSGTNVTGLSAAYNSYDITLTDGTFDLDELSKFGFKASKATDWTGGTVEGNTLTVNSDTVTYKYDCGNGHSVIFTLDATPKYTVTVGGIYHSHYGNEPGDTYTNDYAAGENVSLLIGKRDGYTLKDLTLVGISENDITWAAEGVENEQRAIRFTMPANNVTITVNWTANSTGGGSSSGGGGGGSIKKYSVTASENIENGTVTISPKNASAGSKVTVTVTPDEGYALESFVIKDENGKEIKLTDNGNGKYTFTMPSGKVTVEPSFKAETAEPVEPAEPAKSVNPFTDVPSGAYYEDAVIWAVEKGITSGTTETTFSPDASCTRAQMLTFMWRAAGSPKATGSNPFTDVSADAYYYDAVLWAVENGITSGISATTFAPDATVTRDQTVTFLYRAAGSPAANGSSFSDVSSDAYYADAVAWAVQQNITSGTGDNQFSPNADCTRAQIVTFLYRYMG